MDSEVLNAAGLHVLLTFLCRRQKLKAGFSRSGKIEATAKGFTDGKGAPSAREDATVYDASSGLDATQVMSSRTPYLLSALHDDYLLLKMCWHILLNLYVVAGGVEEPFVLGRSKNSCGP